MTSVREIMKVVPRISVNSGVEEAQALLRTQHIDCLIVQDDSIVRGIVDHASLSGYPPTRLIADCPIRLWR
mgnify:CR=1 FL=1